MRVANPRQGDFAEPDQSFKGEGPGLAHMPHFYDMVGNAQRMGAVLARQHSIPFYVAAPVSTIDFSKPSGEQIPIEERDAREVTHIRDQRLAPEGVAVQNPAFDVTPHELIAAIITDRGVARPPYTETLRRLVEGK